MIKGLFMRLRKTARRVLFSRVKHRLPIGADEYLTFCEHFFGMYDIPDNASMRYAIATMIMHLQPDRCVASFHFFAVALYKAMANEVAYQFMQDQKTKQKQTVKDGETATVVEFEKAKEAMNKCPEQESFQHS